MEHDHDWHVAPGYERVAEAFVDGAALLGAGGGAFTVLHHGRPVVDLWGGSARPGQPWERDTLGVLMSVTKGLAGACLMLLVDRGQLRLDDLVTDHWPEYGQAGKERTTVEMVLMHTCGALGLPNSHELVGWDGTGFDRYDEIAERLAASSPAWEPGTKQGYHAITYGWIIGELVRRITGRTIGTYFHEEVAVPLGLDTWIGAPAADVARVARAVELTYDAVPAAMRKQIAALLAATRDPRTLNGKAFLADGTTSVAEHLGGLASSDRMVATEFASGGGVSTSRSVARYFAMLGGGGEIDGVRILSDETLRTFDAVTSALPDELAREVASSRTQKRAAETPTVRIGPHLANTAGRVAMPDMMGPNPRAKGAAGAGGQIAFFDPDHDLAVTYLRSHLVAVDVLCPRLIATAYECAAARGDIDGATLPKPTLARRVLHPLATRYLAGLERKALAVATATPA